jgi:amino acid permease
MISEIGQNTIIIYLIIITSILFLKPDYLMTKDGKIKQFGCGPNKTLINLHVITIFSCLITYCVLTMVDCIANK